MKAFLALTLAGLSAAIAVAAPAGAQEGPRARARIAATIVTSGFEKTLTVRLTDASSGRPITRAAVTAAADMRLPHFMSFPARPLAERSPGTYRARVDFLMDGMSVIVTASGRGVFRTTSRILASKITTQVER